MLEEVLLICRVFFLADGNISTGVSANPLHVKGSVVALGGLNLQRNLGSSLNPTTPSEVFEYDIASIFLFPPKLSVEKTRWKEVAPCKQAWPIGIGKRYHNISF